MSRDELLSILRKIGEGILEWVYPTKCVFCHKLMESRAQIVCPACRKSLPYTHGAAAEQKLPRIEKCVSPFYYEGFVRDSLLRYKFNGLAFYSEIYTEFLVKTIDERAVSCDIITWVPLSWQRKLKRKYDQAQLLAEAAAKELGVECVRLLRKRRNIRAQSLTGDAGARRRNIAGAYVAVDPELIRGRNILIFDDIVTTGSTLSECAKVLKKCGAASVTAATVARKRE